MGRKILVVDDEQILVDTIAYNLQQAGYQVTTATDGASALEAAHRSALRTENDDRVLTHKPIPLGHAPCGWLNAASGAGWPQPGPPIWRIAYAAVHQNKRLSLIHI